MSARLNGLQMAYVSEKDVCRKPGFREDALEPEISVKNVRASEDDGENAALMMCQVLMVKYPFEVGEGRMLSNFRNDAECRTWRLEDARLGTYPEVILASALEDLRARGKLLPGASARSIARPARTMS